MPVQSELLKPRAYFKETDENLLEPLDIKRKTLTFTQADIDRCGTALMRESSTLNYSCSLEIPGSARLSKLRVLLSRNILDVDFGGTKRRVFVTISPDARVLTLATGFDKTGIDFDVSKFNDDFFVVFNKVALLVIGEALKKEQIRMETLESRQDDGFRPAPNAADVTGVKPSGQRSIR